MQQQQQLFAFPITNGFAHKKTKKEEKSTKLK